MSKLIVDMEMPTRCPCVLAVDNIGWFSPCFADHGIPSRTKDFDDCIEKGTRPDWCPIKGELVLCGKCYYKDEKRIMDEDALWCRKHHMYVTADWFCADGARKIEAGVYVNGDAANVNGDQSDEDKAVMDCSYCPSVDGCLEAFSESTLCPNCGAKMRKREREETKCKE